MKCYLRPEARAELNDATWHYERAREDLGDEFIEDFLLAITEIEETPTRWPEVEPGVRRFRMSRFPYALIYRVLSDSIDVVAIAHQSRREGYWRDRLK
jgi:toxin ParE1/3/4